MLEDGNAVLIIMKVLEELCIIVILTQNSLIFPIKLIIKIVESKFSMYNVFIHSLRRSELHTK